MGRLDGRRALVTGGATGVGAATARRFLAEGALVVITDIDEEKGQAMAEDLGADCSYFPHDVTSEASWERVITLTKQVEGGLDILVNAAGVRVPSDIEDGSLTHWRQVMSVNADGVFLGCKHGLRAMKEAGGAIVNLASTLAVRAAGDHAAFAASKAAVLSITRSTARHCTERGYDVRCNAVLTAADDSSHYDNAALAIVYLASGEATFVTGVELPVDGGLLA